MSATDTEAAKATGTAGEPNWPELPSLIFGMVDDAVIQLPKAHAVKLLREYGKQCAEAARRDKDGNHADDLRGMLDELQTEFDKQQSAFWACSEKLAQVQRNQETELSDIRILELAEEDFGEQDDRNVKNEALLSFAKKVQAARQPAPVADQLKLICAGFGWRTDGDSNVLADRIEHHIRDLKAGIKARDTVIAERDAALAATAAPVLMKDHEIAQVVNKLRDIAIEFHSAQQLRERIAHVIVPALTATRSQP